MKRAIPWTLAVLFFVAFAASFSELQRMRARFGEVTRHQFHDHQDVRELIIRSSLQGLDQPVVVIGDSLVEMAELPKTLCGRPMVNAGVGGSSFSDWRRLGPKLLSTAKPSAVVVALGANDGRDENKRELLREIARLSPVVIEMPTNSQNFSPKDLLSDGIHLTKVASSAWVAKITSNVETSLKSCD